MLRRFVNPILILAALGVLCSGPVAACVCADEPMPAMPCCPDDPQPSYPDDGSDAQVAAACDPLAADVLAPSLPDYAQPAAVAVAPWITHAPASLPRAAAPEPYASPPIYLVTLRLRN